MLLTRGFRETVEARADREPAFRAGLYQAAVQALLDGDLGTANILLRDVIHTPMEFGELDRRVDIPETSLMLMFGSAGNPRVESLVTVVAALREECQISLTVRASPLLRRRERALERVGCGWRCCGWKKKLLLMKGSGLRRATHPCSTN